MSFDVHCGDCLDVMAEMEENSVDTIITDPPYGLEFMGKDWDKGVPGPRFWREALRVAKPGAVLMAFGGTRTWHRLACAIEDAGWEIRDTICWLYGSGFPKSLDIGKAIDKAAGAEREVVGENPNWRPAKTHGGAGFDKLGSGPATINLTAPATPLAAQWDGWGTSLKPAWEPVIVAMKPRDGTFAHNAETWGVAGLWIDGGRVGTETIEQHGRNAKDGDGWGDHWHNELARGKQWQGRWPANVILDEAAAAMLDQQSGESVSRATLQDDGRQNHGQSMFLDGRHGPANSHTDSGGCSRFFQHCSYGPEDEEASRFFYCAKASRAERNAGLEGMEARYDSRIGDGIGRAPSRDGKRRIPESNHHPTVKPISLLRYLCRLTKTPTGGIVLDPFMGSGSTGCAAVQEGRDFIGIELDAEYCEIARRRIEHWARQPVLEMV